MRQDTSLNTRGSISLLRNNLSAVSDFVHCLVGRAENSLTQLEGAVAIAALAMWIKDWFDVGSAMPAFFCLALTAVTVKS